MLPSAARPLPQPQTALHPAVALMARETRVRDGRVARALGGITLHDDSWVLRGSEFLMRASGEIGLHYRRGEGITLERPDGTDPRTIALWLNGPLYAAIAALNGLRPMRDLDLLVAEDRAIEASQVLAEARFIPDTTDLATLRQAVADDHQLPAQYHPGLGVTIEFHHRLGDPPQRRGYRVPQLDPAGVMARAVAVECGGATIFCPASQDLSAHMIVHALHGHRLDCGPLVLADLYFLALGHAVDWSELRNQAERDGWARGLDLVLALVERSFGSLPAPLAYRPPPAVLDAAEAALLLDPEARGQAETLSDLTASQSGPALARAVLRRLVPDPQVVAQEGGGRSLWAFWPVWVVRRLTRSFRQRGHATEARAAAEVMRWIQA